MKVVACWPRFGPYHIARLNAAANRANLELVGLETRPTDDSYAWRNDRADEGRLPNRWKRISAVGERLDKTLDALRPDVLFVNGWGFEDSLQAIAWAARRRTPFCIFSDSRASDAPRRGAVEWIKRRLLAVCDAALAAGEEHRDYLRALGMPGERIFDGYDVVDNDYFARHAAAIRARAAPARVPNLPDSPYFLSVGRFVAKKNLLGVIRAFELYRSQSVDSPPWSLVLAGDGPLRDEIAAAVDGSPSRAAIIRLPFLQYDALPTAYARAGCFVLASTHCEQWGLVVNEAMASGLPVLVSHRCGCAASLVRDGENGFLLEPDDVPGMAGAMARMATAAPHERQQMGRRSEAIIAHWSLDRFAASFLAAADIAATQPRPKHTLSRLVARALATAKSRTTHAASASPDSALAAAVG